MQGMYQTFGKEQHVDSEPYGALVQWPWQGQTEAQEEQSVTVPLLKRFIAQTVGAVCSRTGYRIVPLTN